MKEPDSKGSFSQTMASDNMTPELASKPEPVLAGPPTKSELSCDIAKQASTKVPVSVKAAADVMDEPAKSVGNGTWRRQTLFSDPLIAALDSNLKQEGIDILRWDELMLEGLHCSGVVGDTYACSCQEHFGNMKLLVRRMHKQALSVSGTAEVAAQQALFRKLNHNHLMPILGLASDRVRSFGLLEEKMPHTLAAVLKSAESSERAAQLLEQAHLQIMVDIASALRYLHSQKVGHG